MLNRGISVSTVTSFFQKNRPQSISAAPTQQDVTNALKPLFEYFNANFAIMKETLTDSAMIMVMTRLWKEVLATIESLLVPPLSDKLSQQRALSSQEMDIVFKWLKVCKPNRSTPIRVHITDMYSFFSISSTPQTRTATLTASPSTFSSPPSITNFRISTSSTSSPPKSSYVFQRTWLQPMPSANRSNPSV